MIKSSIHQGLRASAILAFGLVLALGGQASAQEEKTFSEKAKEYWDKVVKSMESGAQSAGQEFSKLKAGAAKATGAAKEKMTAELDVLSKKWAAAREKLSASYEKHMVSVGNEILALEAKTKKATGPAREKLLAEKEKLANEMTLAKEKLSAAWSSNMTAAGEELAHLKEEAATATESAKAKLAPRMEKLKAEWTKNKEKVSAYLAEDYRKTKEDMEKLGTATGEAAVAAKEKLNKKATELKAKIDELAKQKAPDEAK